MKHKKSTFIILVLGLVIACGVILYLTLANTELEINDLQTTISVDEKKALKDDVKLSRLPKTPIEIQYKNRNGEWKKVKEITPTSKKLTIEYPNDWQYSKSSEYRLHIEETKKTPEYYSDIITINFENKNGLELSAKSALIIDADSEKVLYEKNSDLALPMASITKLMTVLLTIENCEVDDIVTVPQVVNSLDYNVLDLRAGEQYFAGDLLSAMLLPSANEAAFTMAYHISGAEKSFINEMNKKAKELNMTNTHYASSFGADSDSHYSCARDVALIHKELLKYPIFTETSLTKKMTIQCFSSGRLVDLKNTNALLGDYKNIISAKTGTSTPAGCCYTAAIDVNSHTYIIVLLGAASSDNRYDDAKSMIAYIENNF